MVPEIRQDKMCFKFSHSDILKVFGSCNCLFSKDSSQHLFISKLCIFIFSQPYSRKKMSIVVPGPQRA